QRNSPTASNLRVSHHKDLSMQPNQHISRLGFRLQRTDDPQKISRLLRSCGVPAIPPEAQGPWKRPQYLVATTTAGGTAACAGWTRGEEELVLHSVAVA